jgi:hypothetical protein
VTAWLAFQVDAIRHPMIFAQYEATEAPPDRFLTRGPVTRYS